MHSNFMEFDFEMDRDRVTGLSVFLLENLDCLHPKKRHADHKIRMHSISFGPMDFKVITRTSDMPVTRSEFCFLLFVGNHDFAIEKATRRSQNPDLFEF